MKKILIPIALVLAGLVFARPAAADTCATRPASGNHSITDACSFPNTIDGVDSGTGDSNTAVLTIASGGTLTVSVDTTLAVGSLSLTGGSVVTFSGSTIKIGTALYVVDADADGYPASITTFYTASGASRVRRNTLTALQLDCNDASYSANNTCCLANGTACSSDGVCCSSVCGTDADSDSYFSSAAGHTGTCKASALPYTDCNDGSGDYHPGAGCQCGNNDYNCSGGVTTCLNVYSCTTCTGGYRNVVVPGIQSGTGCGSQGNWWVDAFPGQTCVPIGSCPASTTGTTCMTCQ